jgi:hypothetical protein
LNVHIFYKAQAAELWAQHVSRHFELDAAEWPSETVSQV